jgi:REP element-mobilizing transposase RayT
MGIRLRGEEPGAIYHVMARGVDRRRIFVDDEDYDAYTGLLGAAARRYRWHLLCYCLMPNHVHLMIETPETTLGDGMQWFHSIYVRRFNKRHGRRGHLFEERFKSPKVRSDEAFIRLVGYIALNPVAATLCKRASDWRWGSHRVVAKSGRLPSWLAHRRLREHLEAMIGSDCYEAIVEARERERY